MNAGATPSSQIGGGGRYQARHNRWFSPLPWAPLNVARNVTYSTTGLALSAYWRPERIMVLSHMRSGSSLLTQLLASHDEILGYGELHLGYQRTRSLWAMNGKIAWVTRTPRPRSRYVVDKVLHNYLLTEDAFEGIRRDLAAKIFLVREPAGALRSLVASFGLSENDALHYYNSRLRTLATLAGTVEGGDAVALTYDQVLGETAEAFRLLEEYLGLGRPLQERYQPHARGADPSANLQTGRILRDDKVISHDAQIDPSRIAEANEVYIATWSSLRAACRTLAAAG
jgi:hypothetical protein